MAIMILLFSTFISAKISNSAIKHKKYHCYGVQFHPESILQEQGKKILKNFLDI